MCHVQLLHATILETGRDVIECVLFQNLTNLDRSTLRRNRYSPVKKNAERFARSDLDLSDCEKERTHCRLYVPQNPITTKMSAE